MTQHRPGSDAAMMVADVQPGMGDAAFMEALDHGPPAPLSVYRRAYATAGVPWPGDDEVRRRHPVTDDGDEESSPSVHLLRWRNSAE